MAREMAKEADVSYTFYDAKLENEEDDIFDEAAEKETKLPRILVPDNDDIFDEALERKIKKDIYSTGRELYVKLSNFVRASAASSEDTKWFMNKDIIFQGSRYAKEELCIIKEEAGNNDQANLKSSKQEEDADDVFDEERERGKTYTAPINFRCNPHIKTEVLDDESCETLNLGLLSKTSIKQEHPISSIDERSDTIPETFCKQLPSINNIDDEGNSMFADEKNIKADTDVESRIQR